MMSLHDFKCGCVARSIGSVANASRGPARTKKVPIVHRKNCHQFCKRPE